MAKKRTSLDALFNSDEEPEIVEREVVQLPTKIEKNKTIKKAIVSKEAEQVEQTIIKQTVYLPSQVHEQLRLLAFEERKKMHDYLVEGLERVFKNRGLKSYDELIK